MLDGNENQAVACVRSLARAGHDVWVGASSRWSKAGWSAFCRHSFAYPDPQRDPVAFVHCIAEEAGREPGTLVLPLTERTTLLLSTRRHVIFAAGARLTLPPHVQVLRAFDKLETTRLSQSCVGPGGLRTEIVEAKKRLEQLVGQRVDHFSCPGGRWDRRVGEVAQPAGFRSAATSRIATNLPQADPCRLARVTVLRGTSLAEFQALCRGQKLFARRMQEMVLGAAKGVFGNWMYGKLRSALLGWS